VQWVGAEILYKDDTAGIAAVGQEDDATKIVWSSADSEAPRNGPAPPRRRSQKFGLNLQNWGWRLQVETPIENEQWSAKMKVFNCEWP
jgi:hypothetical protein